MQVSELKVQVAVNSKAKKIRPNKASCKSFAVKIVKDDRGNEEKHVELTGARLVEWLRDNVNLEAIYDSKPVVDVYDLSNQLDFIKTRAARTKSNEIVAELVSFLEEENKDVLARIRNLLDRGQISFGLCKTLFAEGTEIEIHGDQVCGGKVIEVSYNYSVFMGRFLQITYQYVGSNGRTFALLRNQVRIRDFSGVKEVAKLPVRPLSPEVKAKLAERGKLYRDIGIGAHYMQYQGMMAVKKWWSWDQMRADGRVMIDSSTYSQFVDDDYGTSDHDDNDGLSELGEEHLWMTDPYIKGFAFATKQWGRFVVGQVSPIQFRDHAFDQLVLAQDKKDLIRALVTNGTSGFSDIISNKGGGCIFLLHGEPGVGKTLTAEAISELLRRPLYSVGVGELGTNTKEMEESLRQILDVAQIWNAVILLDEADIFLEKRGHDVVRTAMTSIMLKMLEYHQGVMFLTTNRVQTFDPAFYSRISVALKYGDLDEAARAQIWTNLLLAAGITGLDVAELAKVEINGRQIKNLIRLAQGLAAQQGVQVNQNHIIQCMNVARQFVIDLAE